MGNGGVLLCCAGHRRGLWVIGVELDDATRSIVYNSRRRVGERKKLVKFLLITCWFRLLLPANQSSSAAAAAADASSLFDSTEWICSCVDD